jgi:hypothetical protein
VALQQEAIEKKQVAKELARKQKEEAKKSKKGGGKKPPPKKEPQKKKVQQERSLIGVHGQPSGELGRIYMAAPKDKHLAMLPNNRLPVSCRKVACSSQHFRCCLDDRMYEQFVKFLTSIMLCRTQAHGCVDSILRRRRQQLPQQQRMWVASTL